MAPLALMVALPVMLPARIITRPPPAAPLEAKPAPGVPVPLLVLPDPPPPPRNSRAGPTEAE